MKRLQGFIFELMPNGAQQRDIRRFAGSCRFVFNKALALQRATKWFIIATFHDQHHKFFNYNYGGYTTIWDWVCGTVRPKFEADFAQLKARVNRPLSPAVAMAVHSPER